MPESNNHPFSGRFRSGGKACAGLLFLLVVAAPGATCGAQATTATATRRAMLQVGGGYSLAGSDYSQRLFRGGSLYATYDFAPHLGVEFMLHQVNTPYDDKIYERTYELGPRYVFHYRRLEPFVKVSYGRGVFNYPNDIANLAYNMVTAAGGVDAVVHRHVTVRAEYEVQRWLGFPPNGLQPTVATFGAAYRF